jgi:hypothetical protein
MANCKNCSNCKHCCSINDADGLIGDLKW